VTSGLDFDFRNNKISFDSDSTNTYIIANTDDPEDLEIHADQDVLLLPDNNVGIGTTSPSEKLTVSGNTYISGTIDAPNLGAGVDNSVVILDSDGKLRTDEIDSRVWGTTLVDSTNGFNNRIATFTDSNSINGESNLTFDGTILSVSSSLYVEESIETKPQTTAATSGKIISLTTSYWDTLFFTHTGGEYLRVGAAISTTAGNLYNLGSSGWVAADADATSTSTGLLGIAPGSGTLNTFITEGYVLLTAWGGTAAIGSPVYVSTTAGEITFTAPTGSGDVVRIVGHCVDRYISGRDERPIIRFNPSNDWIELT
jgi:hypothetical protein